MSRTGREPEVEVAVAADGLKLPRSLCVAMALQFGAGGAIIPFVTLVLLDRGLDIEHISRIILSSSAALAVFPFLWGMLADRYVSLNRLFSAVNLLAGAALAVFGWSKGFTGLLISFTLFTACLVPMFTLINALAFHHLHNPREQFGVLRAWGSLGWIVPFLPISLWMACTRENGLGSAICLGVSLCLAMAIFSLWLPHTPPGARRRPVSVAVHGDYLPALRRLLSDANYLILLASMFLMAGSYSLQTYYSPPFLEEMGVPRPWIGPVQSIGVICEILFFQTQTALIRRWNYHGIMLLGCAALLARHLVFSMAGSVWILCLSYVLAGMVIVFYHMGVSMLVNTMSAPEVRSTAQTLLVFFGSGVGPMVANALAGRVAAYYGNNLRPVFLLAALLAGLAALLLLVRGRQLQHPPAVQ